VAVITGASSGIGAGISRVLADKGLHCVLVSNVKDMLDEVKDQIVKAGGTASVYCCDLTDKAQVKQMCSGVLAALGVPDILVNGAGMSKKGNIEDADYESWDKIIDLNIKSHLYVLGQFVPGMKERGTGHIVNITSRSELDPCGGYGVYCGTKSFWTGLSGSLREELLGTAVKVTHVRPGNVDTPLFQNSVADFMEPGLVSRTRDKVMTTEDIGQVVWEVVSRPGRCYQTDVTIRDMFVFDPEVMEYYRTSGQKKE